MAVPRGNHCAVWWAGCVIKLAHYSADLVTREEFAIELDLVKRTQLRADRLEQQLLALEQRMNAMKNNRG